MLMSKTRERFCNGIQILSPPQLVSSDLAHVHSDQRSLLPEDYSIICTRRVGSIKPMVSQEQLQDLLSAEKQNRERSLQRATFIQLWSEKNQSLRLFTQNLSPANNSTKAEEKSSELKKLVDLLCKTQLASLTHCCRLLPFSVLLKENWKITH